MLNTILVAILCLADQPALAPLKLELGEGQTTRAFLLEPDLAEAVADLKIPVEPSTELRPGNWQLVLRSVNPAQGNAGLSREIITSGSGIPDARELLSALRPFWFSRRRWLDAFLAENPHCSEAWARRADVDGQFLDSLLKTTGLDNLPFPERRGVIPRSLLQDVWGRMQISLSRLLEDSAWQRWGHPEQLARYPVRGSALPGRDSVDLLGRALLKMGRDIRNQLGREPSSPALWNALGEMDWMRMLPVDELLEDLQVAPGTPLPWIWAEALIQDLEKRPHFFENPEAHRRAIFQALDQVDRIKAHNLAPGVAARRDTGFQAGQWAAWLKASVRLLERLPGQTEPLVDRLDLARTALGPEWHQLAFYVDFLVASNPDLRGPLKDRLEALKRIPAPSQISPPKKEDPLQLLLVGNPTWANQWRSLRDAPEFATWTSAELRWGAAPTQVGHDSVALPLPGWCLMRGQHVLASGTQCPNPRRLNDVLESHGTPALKSLNAFLKANPEHLEARRQRLHLLLSEPKPAWEVEALKDTQVLCEPFYEETFEPTADWRRAAPVMTMKLEERLRAWPSCLALWKAWVDWNSLVVKPADLALFRKAMPVPWGDHPWLEPEGQEVAASVAEHLFKGKRWDELDAWCRGYWREWNGFQTTSPALPRLERLVQVWEAALISLGKTAELARMQPVWIKAGMLPNRDSGPIDGGEALVNPEQDMARWCRIWGPRGLPSSELERWTRLCQAKARP